MPTIQNRRATAAQWTAANPVLAAGELGFELDTNSVKIGDGLTAWETLPYLSDESLSELVETGRLSELVLNATYQPVGDYAEADAIPPVYADRIAAAAGGFAADGMFARLDMRDPAPVIVAQASDSTGDYANEWFETAWRESLAALWPERPARIYRWHKDTDTYLAPIQWQQGTPVPLVAGADTFATDGALAGRIPDAGAGPWETINGTWVVAGGGISQTDGDSFGNAGFPVLPSGSIDGTYTFTVDMVGTGATQAITFFPLMGQVSTSGDRFSVNIAGSGGLTCLTSVMVNGTETALGSDNTNVGTLTTGQVTTLEVELVIDGLTVTTSINGTALGTYTLTQAQRDALAGKHYAVLTINKSPDTKITAVSVETTDSNELSMVTAYNGGYAGGRLSHQLDRFAAMFPVHPDVMFINHGHNYSSIDRTPGAFLARVDEFADALHATYPGVPIVVISQNPEFPTGTRTSTHVTEHRQRQVALRSHCRQRGWGYIPAFEALAALPDAGQSHVSSDGVHPVAAGSRLMADTAKAWIADRSER